MHDDPRECRRADGMSKVSYPTKKIAKRAARRSRSNTGVSLQAYRCGFCTGIHLGNKRPSTRVAARW